MYQNNFLHNNYTAKCECCLMKVKVQNPHAFSHLKLLHRKQKNKQVPKIKPTFLSIRGKKGLLTPSE